MRDTNEKYLQERFGRGNHFAVPEGFFDSIAEQVMQQLPEKSARTARTRPTMWQRYRYTVLAAACICAAVFGTAVYLAGNTRPESKHTQSVAEATDSYNSDAREDYMDYTMMDNEDIYKVLAQYQE